MAVDPNLQITRWVFTLNNYLVTTNYKERFESFDCVRRVVFGYEVAPNTGTPHLQGYLEFNRSKRVCVCRRILADARWEPATESSLINYRYCIKGGNFETYGDWIREANGIAIDANAAVEKKAARPLSGPMIIAGLLNPATSAQVKVSQEYADKFTYYDRISKFVDKARFDRDNFATWRNYLLYPWQYEVRPKFYIF